MRTEQHPHAQTASPDGALTRAQLASGKREVEAERGMTSPLGYPRHRLPVDGEADAAPPAILRLRYRTERYRRSADAIVGIRTQLSEGWRIVEIRGPVDGPLEVGSLREVSRER